jgi:hypothetical protein
MHQWYKIILQPIITVFSTESTNLISLFEYNKKNRNILMSYEYKINLNSLNSKCITLNSKTQH